MTTNQIITIHSVLKSAAANAEAKANEAANALHNFMALHGIDDWGKNTPEDCKE